MSEKKRILYLANVQGPYIVKTRGIVRNYSIAGNTKVFGITKALNNYGHSVIIYSPGTVAERTGKFHASSNEVIDTLNGSIHMIYGSTIDNRILRNFIEPLSAFRLLLIEFKRNSINTVFLYNVSFLTLFVAILAKCLGKNVYLEYEDSAVASRSSFPPMWKKIYRIHECIFRQVLMGAFAPSLGLLKDLGVSNQLCLPGALDEDLVLASSRAVRPVYSPKRPLRLIYAGGLDLSKGVDLFLRAVEQIDSPLEIHICGKGPLEEKIVKLCSTSRHVATFHGLVSRKELLELMVHADVGVNAHRSDLHEGGSWPFKVVEYLATCGTVFCNSSGNIPMEMQAQLFLYQSNELSGITTAFRDFIQAWPSLQKSSSQRRAWALEQFGAKGIVNQLETLMAGKCVQVQAR